MEIQIPCYMVSEVAIPDITKGTSRLGPQDHQRTLPVERNRYSSGECAN